MQLTIIAALVAFLLGGAGGATVAWKIKEGEQAQAQVKDLHTDVDAFAARANDAMGQLATSIAEASASLDRLNAISTEREHDREDLTVAAASLATDLTQLRRADPQLDACELGDGFLRHWNEANSAGDANPAGAIESAPGSAGESPGDVPSTPTAAESNADRGVIAARSRGADVPGLPEPGSAPARRGERMGGNELALVLPRAEATTSSASEVRQ